ncbi:MAG: isochorismate synthase [Flavobacterium sp.]|uniref:isochorismate synthase n=1 Tax=Flavobacterium sp. TaxID=239 RepID=UPI00121F0A3B|nr:isochorismate synthase [Flavobacterium sp.]RZJ65967.1 MAG: isochorismate synthase [Flavobacterium sp.]
MEFFEKAQSCLSDGKPFVLFRKPDETTVSGMFQRDRVSHGCNKCDVSGFVFAPFAGDDMLYLPELESDIESVAFLPKDVTLNAPELEIDEIAKKDFEALVNKAVAEIKEGTFDKVVLSRTEKVALEDFDIFEAFKKLAWAYPKAFVYLWFHPETNIWMAATPEKLLKANGNSFETMALAGTQKFQGDANVEWPRKEREEQRFVTDFIWNSLEGLVSEIELSEPYTYQAGNLLHIRTDIKGQLASNNHLPDVIFTLHPTPAVCGLPKQAAREFILANEGYDREFYSGFVGELNLETGTDLYVNLRCMKIIDDQAQLFMGCGITKDSVAEKEFFETVNKALTVKKCL